MFALLLSSLLLSGAATANAVDVLTNSETVAPPMNTQRTAPVKEQIRGAPEQFLQHQAALKGRAPAGKDVSVMRVQNASSTVLEQKKVFKENVLERRSVAPQRNALQDMKPEQRIEAVRVHAEERKAQLMEKRATLASTTQERRERIVEKHGERTSANFEQAVRLLNAMVVRLTGLADRIDARIDEVSGAGGDARAAESALASARIVIANTEASVGDLADAISAALTSDTPRESLQSTRALADAAKASIRGAHEALKEAAQALPRSTSEPAL